VDGYCKKDGGVRGSRSPSRKRAEVGSADPGKLQVTGELSEKSAPKRGKSTVLEQSGNDKGAQQAHAGLSQCKAKTQPKKTKSDPKRAGAGFCDSEPKKKGNYQGTHKEKNERLNGKRNRIMILDPEGKIKAVET